MPAHDWWSISEQFCSKQYFTGRLCFVQTKCTSFIEESSNVSILCAFIVISIFENIKTQNLKFKSQNNIVGYDLYYFIYVVVQNCDM